MIGLFNNGKDVPAVGSAMGIERLLLVLENQDNIITDRLDAFIVSFKETENEVLKVMQSLRANNISCDYDFTGKSVKNQFKSANKRNARYAVILGEDEFRRGMCKLKNMDSSEEKEVSINDIHSNILHID